MSKKEKLLNVYMDLNRAAKYYFLDPSGQTHKMFLIHALGVLKSINNQRVNLYKNELVKMGRKLKTNIGREKRIRIADKILTIGLLLKP